MIGVYSLILVFEIASKACVIIIYLLYKNND